MTFCIYSNSHVTDSDANEEHIFPLTLGGSDEFTIKVSKLSNSRVNRELDERLKSSFFLAVNRKKYEARGHRNKIVAPPKAKINVGLDGSVVFKFDENDLLRLYSNKRRKLLDADDLKEEGVKFKIKEEILVGLKFTAKVALASGYFVYKDFFVDNAKISELRELMNYHGELHDEAAFSSLTSTGWYWPTPVRDEDHEMHAMFQCINEMFNCSFVALITSLVQDKIIFVVGILGHLTGVISCPANWDAFPESGDYDLGHVVVLKNKELQRMSFRSCLQKLELAINSA